MNRARVRRPRRPIGSIAITASVLAGIANAQTIAPSNASQATPANVVYTLPPTVVTATRTETPANDTTSVVTVLTIHQVQQSPTNVLDDTLRSIPSFNTFRRSSSMVTAPADDPEAQGVTLRGVGPGGASRALILLDGIPVNDAFGGWIYWDEIPLGGIQQVEVVEGGSSNLWGNEAEGGVINIVSRRPEASGLQMQASYGNRNTTSDEIAADAVRGPFRARIEGDFFNTGGWNIVAPAFRGPIDHNSSSIHEVFSGLLEYKQSQNVSAFLRGSYYHEALDLGAALRSASATRGFIDGGGELSTRAGDHFQLSTYAHVSSYDESFALANSTRTAETRSQLQTVPSRDVGGFLTWTRDFFAGRRGLANQLTAGGDFRLIEGSSRDRFFDPTGSFVVNRQKSSGGQNFFGVFAEDLYHPLENLQIVPSVRFDFFQNFDGRIANRPSAGASTITTFPDRMRTATSPRLGVRYAPQHWLAIRAALYEAFRAPTLAELYRQSTVENLILIPNPRLGPEFLEGGEVGFDLRVAGLTLGMTGYWNILHDPISNVVTAVNPMTGQDAARTRENLGRARIRGYEIQSSYEVEWLDQVLHFPRDSHLRLTANFLKSEATLVSNPPDPTLVGRRLALVPWQNLELGMHYSDPSIGEVLLQEQYHGKQWEDSDNHDLQPSYWLTNLTLSHPIPPLAIAPWLQDSVIFLKFQNLLNHRYIVDFGGGIPKIGTPFMVLGGLSAPLKF